MLPLLKVASNHDEEPFSITEIVEELAEEMGLSDYDLYEVLPSGTEIKFRYNLRLHWACNELFQARLLNKPTHDRFMITTRGSKALASKPEKIDPKFLSQYPEYKECKKENRHARSFKATRQSLIANLENIPEENLRNDDIDLNEVVARSVEELNANLTDILTARIDYSSSELFYRIVIKLLYKLGYASSLKEAMQQINKDSDGCIEGVLQKDQLGMESVYIRAMKYAPGISANKKLVIKSIEKMDKLKQRVGIIFASSRFLKDAIDEAREAKDKRIILVDMGTVVNLMIENNVGVYNQETYHIKNIDENLFTS